MWQKDLSINTSGMRPFVKLLVVFVFSVLLTARATYSRKRKGHARLTSIKRQAPLSKGVERLQS